MVWQKLAIMVVLELISRKGNEDRIKNIVDAADSPEAAMEAVLNSPDLKESAVLVVADLLENVLAVFGGKK